MNLTFIEGPEREEQFTLQIGVLQRGVVHPYEVEIVSPLFTDLNRAVHGSHEVVSLVGKDVVNFKITANSDEPWAPPMTPRRILTPQYQASGAIHPDPQNSQKVSIEFAFTNNGPRVMGYARRLADGFTTAAAFLVFAVGVVGVFGVGGLLLNARAKAEMDHVARMAAIKHCVHFSTENSLELSATGKAKVPGHSGSAGAKSRHSGKCTVHKLSES